MSNRALVALLLPALAAVACGGATPAPQAPAAETSTPPASAATPSADAPSTFAEQVTLGAQLYGQKCAECHGASGEGNPGPRLVGLDKGALPLDPPPSAKARKSQFKTVADIAAFVVAAMPPKAPGSLSEQEYWAILAFDLKANGIDLGQTKLDAALAKTLEVPRH
jgi:cytochrome c